MIIHTAFGFIRDRAAANLELDSAASIVDVADWSSDRLLTFRLLSPAFPFSLRIVVFISFHYHFRE